MSENLLPEPPLRIGTREDFARVARTLDAAGFDEATVCRALRIEEMADLGSVTPENAALKDAPASLALFIRLFLFMDLMPRETVERMLDQSTLEAFLKLDLLRIGEYGVDQYYTPVFLYPVAGFYIASDRHSSPDGSEFKPPADIVFPAIFTGTLRFLRLFAKSPARDALDLCSGSGIGALVLSPHVEHAVASDITERAAHFANFNRLLNGRENVEPVCGDLYSAVEGRTFERITAHPPYMPTFRPTALWRDGGETGENLVQRIVKGLPQYLRPGGTAYIVSLGLDTQAGQFEARAREWLGDAQSEFDIIFAYGNEVTPQEIVKGIGRRDQRAGPEDLARLEQAFELEKTIRLIYGALVLRRRAEPASRAPWTARMRLSTLTEGSDFEWAFDWHERRQRTEFLDELAHSKPKLSPALRVKVTHVVEDGELIPADFILESDKPFLNAMRFDGWAVPLIAQFNGELTPPELYRSAREEAAMPETFGPDDFLKLVAMLIERGYLIL